MLEIKMLSAREILDSRGNPTVEVALATKEGRGIAAVPSGASTGMYEALELRDGDKSRYGGKGVLKAVANVNKTIARKIVGKEFAQESLDHYLCELDGTENKSKLGANAILGVSLAFARAAADEAGIELYEYLGNLTGKKKFSLPSPMLNVINGGKHADSGLDIQEFMIVPRKFKTFARKIQAGAEIIAALRKMLQADGYTVAVGDEGGFAPKLPSDWHALEYLVRAIRETGYTENQVGIALDVAASSFFEKGVYHVRMGDATVKLQAKDLIAWYSKVEREFPIISIEDGLAEDDWDGFAEMTKRLGKKMLVVGDDLLVTNIKRIERAVERKAANAVLIKLSQIGTLTETLQAIKLTQKTGWTPVISHRSGETTDTFIADLAVGVGAPFIKTGSLIRGERVCKYNRLMEIESGL